MELVVTTKDIHLVECEQKPCTRKCFDHVLQSLIEYKNKTGVEISYQVLFDLLRFLQEGDVTQKFKIPSQQINDPQSNDAAIFMLNVYYSKIANSIFILRRKPENMHKCEIIFKNNHGHYNDMELIYSSVECHKSCWFIHSQLAQVFETGEKKTKFQFQLGQCMDPEIIKALVTQALKKSIDLKHTKDENGRCEDKQEE